MNWRGASRRQAGEESSALGLWGTCDSLRSSCPLSQGLGWGMMPTSTGSQPGPLITLPRNSETGRQPLGPLHPAAAVASVCCLCTKNPALPRVHSTPLHCHLSGKKRCSANCIIGTGGKWIASDGFQYKQPQLHAVLSDRCLSPHLPPLCQNP